MRALTLDDYFRFAQMIVAIDGADMLRDINGAVNAFRQSKRGDTEQEELGIRRVWAIISHTAKPEAAQAIYSFLSPIVEIPMEQLHDTPIKSLVPMLSQILKENDILDFFGAPRGTGQ